MRPKPLGATLGWITRSSRYLFESPWFRLRQDELSLHGKPSTYTWLENSGTVFVVPVTRAGEIVLIRIYRYTVDAYCWEVPSGGLNDKQGHSLEEAARAELREEAGFGGGTFEQIGTFFASNGAMDVTMNLFLARDVERIGAQELEEGEQIDEVRLVPWREAEKMARSGEIRDGESALAILLAAQRLV